MQTTPQILQMLAGTSSPQAGPLAQIKQMIGALRSTANPQAILQQMIQQKNPALAQAVDYIRRAGGDPRAAFRKLAAEKGIDPGEVEALMK